MKCTIKKYCKNLKTTFVVIFFVFFLFEPCIFSTELNDTITKTISINFDTPLPTTWYQKSLNSLLYMWQVVESLHAATEDEALSYFDLLLSKCAFAHFCMEKMNQEQEFVLEEDNDYLIFVIKKIKILINSIHSTEKTKDLVKCINFFLESS